MEALIAGVVALVWCGFAIWLGPKLGFVDRPDDEGLKPHGRPVVPLGGIGVFAGVHIAMAVGGIFDWWLLAASGIVLLLGLVDDRRPLPPVFRLLVEVVAGAVLGLRFFDGFGIVAAAVLVVVAANAVNLFDGLDGLAGSAAVVTGLGFMRLASQRFLDPAFGWAMAGAALGFLVLNWRPAKVFLGDNGSYVIGVFIVYGMLYPEPAMTFLGPNLLLLGVFGLDLVVTVVRRWRTGRSLFVADRSHLYDRLHDRGIPVPAVAAIAAVVQAVFVVAAVEIDWWTFGTVSWVLVGAVGLVTMVAAVWFARSPVPDRAGD
jgi:UDP-GlcNAc:undecaprenyl-phosphate GlcNAc-1-phosphate transferase